MGIEVKLSRAPLCRLSSEGSTICLKVLGQRGETFRIRRQPQQGLGDGSKGGFRRRRFEEHKKYLVLERSSPPRKVRTKQRSRRVKIRRLKESGEPRRVRVPSILSIPDH